MFYIIRQKSDHKIVKTGGGSDANQKSAKTIHKSFDPKKMEIAWQEHPHFPDFFEVGEDGEVVELPHPGTVFINDNPITLGYKVVKGKAKPKTIEDLVKEGEIKLDTPFEYLHKNEIKRRSLEQVKKDKAVQTQDEADKYLKVINQEILNKISIAIPIHEELKLTKAYFSWLNDGKPKNDEREQEYNEMEKQIAAIKKQYASMKAYAKEVKFKMDKKAIDKNNTKAEIQAFLEEHDVDFTSKETKADLLKKLKKIK